MPAQAVAQVAAGSKEYKSLGLQLQFNTPFITYVFIKKHQPRDGEADIGYALYVTGLPLGLTDELSLQQLFGVFGEVQTVAVHPTKRSAAVVYKSKDDLSEALAHASSGQIIECPLPLPDGPVGLKAWIAEHKAQRPGNEVLQEQLDEWVEAHEAAEAARVAARQAAMADDGWTVVVRSKGRKRAKGVGGVSTVSGGIAAAAASVAHAAAEAKQVKQANNFYRFQQRDKRRNGELGGTGLFDV
eukprot:GHRR01007644.1.p1 GENE.GHRR01007644.1~~GHRR01007644.1.p1  ORF type:complete len:243 (+),score=85.44 GHRR01007644.1:1304-2032(+)